jgi:hypothetical protein
MENKTFELDGNQQDIAKNFQTCAGLEVADEHSAITGVGLEPFAVLMGLQQSIQEEVYGYDFAEIGSSYKKLMRFVNWNYGALQDEWRELYTSLGGMSTYGMAFWKPWKKDHTACMASSFEKLSGDEKLEAQYEVIDLMHFMFNMGLALGINQTDAKFFFWNIEGEYTCTMSGKESLADMLNILLDSPDTIGKYNAIRHSNDRLLDFVDWKMKHWQGRMITLFECLMHTDFGWYLGNETSDKRVDTNRRAMYRKEITASWTEAYKPILHIAAVLGMTEKAITNLYFAKNLENRARQQRPGGY